jgi:hypothetical protein
VAARLDIKQARQIVADLAILRPELYWMDFIASYVFGWFGFVMAQSPNFPDWATAAWYCISGFAFYRALSFIHEIAHFRSQLGSFWIVWNALCGIPMAMPSFLYYRSHYVHHNPKLYGTKMDGEYIAFVHEPRFRIITYVLLSFFAPVFLMVRFTVLFPISLVVPTLRKWLVEKGSALVIDPDFVSEAPVGRTRIEWFICECGVFVFWATLITLAATEVITAAWLLHWVLLMGAVSIVNALRTLAAHRWGNASESLSLEGQYLDSINLTSATWAWLNALIAPVGLRYHALHHLFPFLPYHALGQAHRRLVEGLTRDSGYHMASEAGLHTALKRLWLRQGFGTEPHPKPVKNEPVIPLS